MEIFAIGFILQYFRPTNKIKMGQIITLLIIMIAIGTFIYLFKFKNKEKPKIGIKRDNPSDYYKNYFNLNLYWLSIAFIFFGIFNLIALLIIEIIFD